MGRKRTLVRHSAISGVVNQLLAEIDSVGNNNEGVTSANLTNATAVAAEFNSEFNIIANPGQDAVLVINDTNGNNFAVWEYTENGTTPEIQTNELRLIGLFNSNGAILTGNIDLA